MTRAEHRSKKYGKVLKGCAKFGHHVSPDDMKQVKNTDQTLYTKCPKCGQDVCVSWVKGSISYHRVITMERHRTELKAKENENT